MPAPPDMQHGWLYIRRSFGCPFVISYPCLHLFCLAMELLHWTGNLDPAGRILLPGGWRIVSATLFIVWM